MTQSIDGIMAAIGGPTAVPHQPEGGSDVVPLGQLGPIGLDRVEPAPPNVLAQQGAGSAGGYLTPGGQGTASEGTVEPGNVHGYSASGPAMLTPPQGIGALTAGGNFGANRPSGSTAQPAMPAPEGSGTQVVEQGINPALKAALTPRPGPFGNPTEGK